MAILGIETIISLKIIFRFINAKENVFLVNKVYQWSDSFLYPFQGIAGQRTFKFLSFTFDVEAFAGLFVYMILAFFVIELIKIFNFDE